MRKNPLLVFIPTISMLFLRESVSSLRLREKTIILTLAYVIAAGLVFLFNMSLEGGLYFFVFLGFFGFTLMEGPYVNVILAFLLPLYVLLNHIAAIFFRTLMMYPLMTIGAAFVIHSFKGYFKRGLLSSLLALLVISTPALVFTHMDYGVIFKSSLGEENLREHQAIKEFVEKNADKYDLTVMPAELAHIAGKTRVSYWPQVLAYGGVYADYGVMNNIIADPSDIPANRFLYRPVLTESSVVVLDGAVYEILNESITFDVKVIDTWSKKKIGRYTVYANPNRN
jgi:hypothetical protein